MRRSFLSIVALLGITGCAHTITAARTRPEIETTARPVAKPSSRSILVISPSALADVNVEWAVPRAPGFSLPTAAVEHALFEAGWDPVPKPELQKLVVIHKTAVGLREVTGREGTKLVDLAATLGAVSPAEVTLLVNEWRLGWEPVPNGRWRVAQLCTLTTDLAVSLHDRNGRLLWDGHAHGRSTDLYDLTMVDRGSIELSNSQVGCAAKDASCGGCPQVIDEAVLKPLWASTATAAVRAVTGK